MNVAAAIESKSTPVSESGCWLWLGSTNDKGYGYSGIRGMPSIAHRASFAAFVGPIPSGMNVCHKCDTPSCVNPDHLFIGTQRENILDCRSKGRMHGQQFSHCHQGHEFTEENTMFIRGTQRQCRQCQRERNKEHMRRKRAALTSALNREEG